MRLTKIYTKIGDKGTTMLASGEIVSKSSLRIDAYGTVDELNAVVGMLQDVLLGNERSKSLVGEDVLQSLTQIQNELFDVGAELSTPHDKLNLARQAVVGTVEIQRLEQQMDAMNERLPALANFILPGGHLANSTAHLARTVCRRAERCVVRLAEQEPVRDDLRIYLNRLSDWFFVSCRAISSRLGVEEVLWQQRK